MTRPTVAVTGATGFIGARLVALLRDERQPMQPRALGRRRAGGTTVDLRDASSVRRAIAGCRAVVHCAFDFQDLPANATIAAVLATECAAAGIRLVHVSSAAVYEPLPDGPLDETGGGTGPGSDYKQIKLAIEDHLIRQTSESGLDVVILQPTVVYGPGGRAWTDAPIRDLLTGRVVLPDAGRGLCNAVYVDDVCRAAIAALEAPVRSGERFLISGPQPTTWQAFFGAYAAMLNLDTIELLDPAASRALREGAEHPPCQPGDASPSACCRPQSEGKRVWQLNLALHVARSWVQTRRHVPAGPKLALFRSRCHVQTGKARQLLQFEPRYDLATGMGLTAPYVRAAYDWMARHRVKDLRGCAEAPR